MIVVWSNLKNNKQQNKKSFKVTQSGIQFGIIFINFQIVDISNIHNRNHF